MRKNLNQRPHSLTVTRGNDKELIQKFLNWEKHPRQKSTYRSESININLPLHLMF